MASRDEDRFRVRPGVPGSQGGPRSQRFLSQVLKRVSQGGAKAARGTGQRPASTFGRGRVPAAIAGSTINPSGRRVVIKSRFVLLKQGGANSVTAHLRYIERDGITRSGQPGQAYGPGSDTADLKAFEERGKEDRHQFRFIVSVEDAAELGDLPAYTRELMQRISTDLETRLDWVAVDHWDTDNPHTHIVLRGRSASTDKRQDLVIAPDYLAHGMRMRASGLATEWLGPRTELEIRQGLLREVEQERMTSLDRVLLKRAGQGIVDLTEKPDSRQRQEVVRARLQQLQSMTLAEQIDANRWKLSSEMESTLIALGERGHLLRTVQRALQGNGREIALHEPSATTPVIGRIAAKGLADELHDRGYLVIDGIDGDAHYVKLPMGTDLSALPVGGIAEAKKAGQIRAVDRTIAEIVRDGLYRTAEHLSLLRGRAVEDAEGTVGAHATCTSSRVQRVETRAVSRPSFPR